MSADVTTPDSAPVRSRSLWSLPSSAIGWLAVAVTVAIFPVAWVLMTHRIPWPVLDTAVAPLILVTVIVVAAALGLWAVVKRRERSVLVLLAVAFAAPVALFSVAMLILEVLFPH
jgi:hypothetical protein